MRDVEIKKKEKNNIKIENCMKYGVFLMVVYRFVDMSMFDCLFNILFRFFTNNTFLLNSYI